MSFTDDPMADYELDPLEQIAQQFYRGDSSLFDRIPPTDAIRKQPESEQMRPGQLKTAEAALAFILAGNAYFTVRSKKTGTRFTFRVAIPKWARKEDKDVFYVSLLNGPDNTSNYTYMGMIRDGRFSLAKKTLITKDAPSYKALEFTMMNLGRKHLPTTLEIWHEGRCGRCGHMLTVPESIERGIGPECAGRLEVAA